MNKFDDGGKKHGYWEYYYFNGNLLFKGNYINGTQDGYWIQNYYDDPHFLYLNI